MASTVFLEKATESIYSGRVIEKTDEVAFPEYGQAVSITIPSTSQGIEGRVVSAVFFGINEDGDNVFIDTDAMVYKCPILDCHVDESSSGRLWIRAYMDRYEMKRGAERDFALEQVEIHIH